MFEAMFSNPQNWVAAFPLLDSKLVALVSQLVGPLAWCLKVAPEARSYLPSRGLTS